MTPWTGRRRSPAIRHLETATPAFVPLIARIGPCTLIPDRGREPYEALIHAIAHQQLHAGLYYH